MNPTTRREALIAIATAPLLNAQHQHSEETPASATPYQPQTLTPSEMTFVAILSDLIIPRTETPGASDAGVPEFIDRRLTASPNLAASFRRGISQLDPAFTQLPHERQVAILTGIVDTPFFRLAKDLTIDGYYSSRAGLVEELGWHGNTFLSEFKGCTHPEHQS
jgi:hypothetical protein